MNTFLLVYLLGFHGALLGWRVQARALEPPLSAVTCQHMTPSPMPGQPVELRSMPRSQISELSFINTFVVLACTMGSIRQHRSPYFLRNYIPCGNANFPSVWTQLWLVLVWVAAILDIRNSWITGYGTPLQLLVGVMLAFCCMWIFAVLTHVLQVDSPAAMPRSRSLSHRWVWASASVCVLWLSCFVFFLSVYRVTLRLVPYLLLHLLAWVAYIAATIQTAQDDRRSLVQPEKTKPFEHHHSALRETSLLSLSPRIENADWL
eukprot:GHVT01020629.1.p1 GENE.GHVT01020629.1~~GHVT01020629.1.p1  ORF type:complete len:262 (+),score=17.70 GHVT01020629.1:1524-2309(+)